MPIVFEPYSSGALLQSIRWRSCYRSRLETVPRVFATLVAIDFAGDHSIPDGNVLNATGNANEQSQFGSKVIDSSLGGCSRMNVTFTTLRNCNVPLPKPTDMKHRAPAHDLTDTG